MAVDGGLADSKMLKNVICGHILQDWQELASQVTLFHDSINTKQPYSEKMIQQNGWETSAEIKAEAVLLKCRINIWFTVTKGFSLQTFSPNDQPMNPFYIRLRNNHFQLLKHVAGSLINSGASSVNPDTSAHNLAELNRKRQKINHIEANMPKAFSTLWHCKFNA